MRIHRCFVFATIVFSCSSSSMGQTVVDPPYANSIVSTDFDIITDNDPTVFESLTFVARQRVEMPDKRSDDAELFQMAFVFDAEYTDETRLKIYVDAKFETQTAAYTEAMRYAVRLGKLPRVLRAGVRRVVVHRGGENVTAFSDQGLIVVYSDNATRRIATNDLEETLFHESVHASWDSEHASSPGWKRAQAADGAFLTRYAESKPRLEDLAESALFAFALLHHPQRLPAKDTERVRATIPNRMLYLAKLLPR